MLNQIKAFIKAYEEEHSVVFLAPELLEITTDAVSGVYGTSLSSSLLAACDGVLRCRNI